MKILAIYFSGTGNTDYVVRRFLDHFMGSDLHSIEEDLDFTELAGGFDTILVAYPIYGSDMPALMRSFLKNHRRLFTGRALITLVTQWLFSGDGAALAWRMVRREAGPWLGSIHVNMPSNVNLPPLIHVVNGPVLADKLAAAKRKIDACAQAILQGGQIRDGRGLFCLLAGLLTQRMWFRAIFAHAYRSRIKVDHQRCNGCAICRQVCPVANMVVDDGQARGLDHCMLCYRCVNGCPQGAISLFSRKDGQNRYQGIGSSGL